MKPTITKEKDWKNKQNEYYTYVRHSQFLKVPKTYLLLFGVEAALIMGFIEQLDYQTNIKRHTQWIYITNDKFYQELGLSAKKVKKQTDVLQKYGLIKKQTKGVPPINYYSINYKMTLEVAKTVNLAKRENLNSQKGRNQISKYREILLLRKNNLDTSLLLEVEDKSSTNIVHKKINGNSSLKNIDTSKYLKLAKKLSNIIQKKKNIKHTPAQIKTWAEEFRKLHTVNKVEPSRQKTILKWYKTSIGGQYIPVVESGKSFREKFIKLEDAMNRKDFTNTPKNNFTHHGNFELTKKSTKM